MLVEVCNISEKELLFAIIRGLNYKLSPNFVSILSNFDAEILY